MDLINDPNFSIWWNREARPLLKNFTPLNRDRIRGLLNLAWFNGAYKEQERIKLKANKLLTTLLGD